MKKTTALVIVMMSFCCATAFGQQKEDKQAKKARKEIAEAQKDLREAKLDSVADYNAFKKEAETSIASNKKAIADLRMKKSEDSKDVKEKYNKKITTLEEKNNDLQKRIDGSGSVKTTRWSSFKREFDRDMRELGRAFRDIGINNTK